MKSNMATVRPLARLLQNTRNRLWLQRILTRLIFGCYLSAGIAIVLAAAHMGFIAVPKMLWWFAIISPIAGCTGFAFFTERPNLTITASIADGWFATDELLTAAQYAAALTPEQSDNSTLRQLGATADATAAKFLQNSDVYPALTADPRITIALLFIALSAFVTFTTNQSEPASLAAIPQVDRSPPTTANKKRWLVLPPAQDAQPTLPLTRRTSKANEVNTAAAIGADRTGPAKIANASARSAPMEDAGAIAGQAPQQGTGQNLQAAASPTGGSVPGAEAASHPTLSQRSAPRTNGIFDQVGPAMDAEIQATKAQRAMLASPIVPSTAYQLQHRSMQISAQADLNATTTAGSFDTLTATDIQQLQVLSEQASYLPRAETNEMAQQLLGPVARTLAADYSERQQP